MSKSRSNLLERKLATRMVQVQSIALLLFFGVGVFPVIILPIITLLGDARPLDGKVMSVFARTFTGTTGDRIDFVPSPELSEYLKSFPDLWIYARTAGGAEASVGEIPPMYADAPQHLWELEALDVRRVGSVADGVALRTEESPVGPVRMISGNGPVLGAANLVGWISAGIAMCIAALVVLVSSIVIPIVVRREMSGLKTVASQAQMIHVETRGTRLGAKDVPDEVVPLVTAVNDALDRLDDSYLKRERFLADSAHELRTPIAILQTRIEAEPPFPAQSRLLLDVARLSGLADQLLDLQRMDLSNNEFAPVDLIDLASQAVGDLAPLANAAGYELSLNAPERAVIVEGDAGSLTRVLTNIVQNAIAYGGNHGEIVVEVAGDGTVSISDQGPGIPAADRDRVFEPFYRVRPSSKGTGLGLNLVEAIIRRHGGKVYIQDARSGGAEVVICLPILRSTKNVV